MGVLARKKWRDEGYTGPDLRVIPDAYFLSGVPL
jgi:hypothetical protein